MTGPQAALRTPGTGSRLARFWIPLLMAVGGMLLVTLFTVQQWREARRDAEAEARHDFSEIMANLQSGVSYLHRQADAVGIQTMIANRGFDPHFRYLMSVDRSGRIYAATRLAFVGSAVEAVAPRVAKILDACRGKRWLSATFHDGPSASLFGCYPATEGYADANRPATDPGRYLIAWYDYESSLQSSLARATQRSMLVWLLFGTGWLTLTVLLVRALDRRRIGQLVVTTERLSAGDLSARVGVVAADELGVIGQAVDRMAADLEKTTHALERSHAELERRVEQRTRELQKANEVLEREIKIRLQTEQSMDASRKFFESVLDAQSAQIGVLDAEGCILTVNDSWRRFGAGNVWSGENLVVGLNYLAACDTASQRGDCDAGALAQGIREVVAGTRVEFHYEYPCPDPNSGRWFVVHVTRMLDRDHRQIVVVHENISERKQAEEKISRNEAWLRGLIETTQDAVVSIDRSASIVLFNAAAEKIFGYSAAEVRGQKVNLLMGQPYATDHDRFIARYEKTGERHAIGQIRTVTAKRKNGELFPIELSVTEIAADEEVRYAAFIRDISEKSRLHDRLVESERLAVLGGAAAKIGHEIANPINGMTLTIQLLEHQMVKAAPAIDNQMAANLAKLKNEISRLNRLVGQFRTISRKEPYEFRPTDLVALIEDVSSSQKAFCASRGIEIVHRFAPNFPEVTVDRDKITQAVLNLFKNAIEAMPNGGVITVSLTDSAQDISIGIADTGTGIPAGLDIFAPFVTSKREGTGIGLVIVRQIVTAHRGSIAYRSEQEHGTTFTITLPIL